MFSPDTEYLRATVLQPDGETDQFLLPEEEGERLRRIQEVVGGHLEVVPIPCGRYLVVSESAKEGLHVINRYATQMALESESILPDDYLAGTVLLVTQRAMN